MKHPILSIFLMVFSAAISSCNHATTETEETEEPGKIQTPVTVTSVSDEPLTEYAELNATSVFQQDNIVKSTINGYIKTVTAKVGQYVAAGQTLFLLKTKEAESLGNTINTLDSSFHFSGIIRISASQSGYITSLDHQAGDYVQDGDQLAVISNSKSFGFVLNIPYELRKYVSLNQPVEVVLPDSTHLSAVVAEFMPAVDSVSQTQQVLLKVSSSANIPENLIAKVRILKTKKINAHSLPKQAVLTDEAQTSFWVMKMMDSVRAIRVPVKKGIEVGDRVEIIEPRFLTTDKILLTGNYGLPDTANVKIVKSE